ncbi:hypothetical protein D3C76_1462790 [compost metagenome]
MRRTGVDHPHVRVDDGRHCVTRGIVRQAQDRHVGAVDGLGAQLQVLALGRWQGQQAQVVAAVQAGVDLQAGGALIAVDKNQGLVHGCSRAKATNERPSSPVAGRKKI